jgi:hypothetical protein
VIADLRGLLALAAICAMCVADAPDAALRRLAVGARAATAVSWGRA